MNLFEELKTALDAPPINDIDLITRFRKRLNQKGLTKDENPHSHFCTHFAPYDPKRGEIFVVDHKRAKTWLFPGGHVDAGECLLDTLNREIGEELGINDHFSQTPQPFLLTIKDVHNDDRPCKTHYDIWFLMEADGEKFNIDMDEFHDTGWMNFKKARATLTDSNNIKALDWLEKNHMAKLI